jgi:hypothetical protein
VNDERSGASLEADEGADEAEAGTLDGMIVVSIILLFAK